jgi:CheY-like chemotaxis protein
LDVQQQLIPKKNAEAYQILLAEDEEVNQMMAMTLLDKMGCDVCIVPDGKEAVAEYQRKKYDIIFMDCKMPVMDGLEATRKIREIENKKGDGVHVPIVALTSRVMTGDRELCLQAGMDDYLPKPIRKEKVCMAINKWCGSYIDYKSMW